MTEKEYNDAVRQWSQNVFRFVMKSCGNQNLSEDIVQTAYMKLWENREKVFFEKCKSWLFVTAHNTLLNELKKEKRSSSLENTPHKEPYHNNNRYDLRDLLDQGLKRLPQLQKSIILLRDLEGYSYDDIGEILSLNPSQVKVYLFRARKKMKQMLQNIYQMAG
ncbi:MAG: RNA polymerase sigma factor [Flavobacteriales bacterium]|nr:RNA polymerase sigma factor [Flavobacteriales bacterium]